MAFFEAGNTAKVIVNLFGRALDFILARKDIIERSGLTEGQVHSALYRLKKKGILVNHGNYPDSIPRGYWRLRRLYRKIRHCLRIIETGQKRKRREWNCDCEATSEGFVPYTKLPFPPEIPIEAVTKRYANILTDKLRESMLVTLGRQGIYLTEEQTYFEQTCNPQFFKVPKFCIVGTEWLDDLATEMGDPETHQVEVAFQNDIGVMYRWNDSFNVSEDEFP